MVVRLQTAEGKIKEYQTIQWKSGGEARPSIYFTACGRKCEDWPGNWNDFDYLNCDHLDCAIAYADAQAKPESMIFAIIVLLIIVFGPHWLEDTSFFSYVSSYYLHFISWKLPEKMQDSN